MEIKGKIYVFVNKFTGKDGKDFKFFRTSVTRKDKDDKLHFMPINVRFVKDLAKKAQELKEGYQYEIEVEEGFLTFSENEEKKAQYLEIAISKATIKSFKEVKIKEPNDLEKTPF